MHEIYNISDLIISRSGANTVAEISVTGIPAILIPFPGAVNNHQYYNADYLVKNGRALLLDDSETSGSNLKKIIKNMISNDFKLYNELKNKKVDNIFLKSHEIIVENIIGD
jgi:UDP-N-acetylglucosamine--N-acetylmuramyl-(pentapeptide) pyrophosphoryl-undecaprenol N-acetylglucosamine transferase